MTVYRLAYVSQATSPEPEVQDVQQILKSSHRNNRRQGLTGGLMVNRARFFQVLEGRQKDVERALERIQGDARHTNVEVVWRGSVAGRLFEGWGMAVVIVDPANRVNIDRVIDEASLYPNAAISSLHRLVQGLESEWGGRTCEPFSKPPSTPAVVTRCRPPAERRPD